MKLLLEILTFVLGIAIPLGYLYMLQFVDATEKNIPKATCLTLAAFALLAMNTSLMFYIISNFK